MKLVVLTFAAASIVACGSYPMPVQRLADAEAAARSASDTGAASDPQAKLHLELAREEIQRAKALIADHRNERADYELIRAKSDAELALAEARDLKAQEQAQRVLNQVDDVRTRGATPVTTSAAVHVTTTPEEQP